MKRQRAIYYMNEAHRYAKKSFCKRRQVGCVIVKDNRIIAHGYNKPPPGQNCCEDKNGVTFPEVYHAEFDAICKAIRNTDSINGTVVFITYGPCLNCAKLIAGMGIQKVYYNKYREGSRHIVGREFLKRYGIEIIELK